MASEWIEWHGDKCPVIDSLRCDMRLRDGTVMTYENSQDWWDDWNWKDREPADSDIVAYRVAKEPV